MNNDVEVIKRKFKKRLIFVQMILVFIFVATSFFTNYYFKKQTAVQIARIISRVVKKGDHREAVYILGSAKLENFTSVGYFDNKGRRIFTLPASLNNLELDKSGLFETSIQENIHFGERGSSAVVGTLKMSFQSHKIILLGLSLWGVALFMTLPLIRRYFNLAMEHVQGESDKRRAKDLLELASMVKHDLRSPLQSILMAVQTSKDLSDKGREMILSGISRIEKITQDLNAIKKKERIEPSPGHSGLDNKSSSLFICIQEIVQEKIHTNRKIKGLSIKASFQDDSISKFINLDETDFKRILSNLIDNAVESFSDGDIDKKVEVAIRESGSELKIDIVDNGPGIPDIVMKKIGTKGITLGKENGSGLGIYSARKKILSSGGDFEINTNSNGTTISLTARISDSPKWFAETMSFTQSENYIILDDDDSVIDRFAKDEGILACSTKFVRPFNDVGIFKSWLRDEADKIEDNSVFFIDYDLKNTEEDGLDIVKLVNNKFKVFLFTNNFDDFFLQRTCMKENIQIIPKTVLGWG